MRRGREESLQSISRHFNLHKTRVAKKTFLSLNIMLWRNWSFLSSVRSVKAVGLSRKIKYITISLLKIVNISPLKLSEDSRESFASFPRLSRRKELLISVAVITRSSSVAVNSQLISWSHVYSKKSMRAKGFLVPRLKLVLLVSISMRGYFASKEETRPKRIKWSLVSYQLSRQRRIRSFILILKHSILSRRFVIRGEYC